MQIYLCIPYQCNHLLRVLASIRVLRLLHPRSNSNTLLVTSRVGNTRIGPDAPGTVDAVGAGNQITTAELQVVLRVDSPAVVLGVLGGGLGAGGIANLSLACTELATSLRRYSRGKRGTHPFPTGQRRIPAAWQTCRRGRARRR